MTVAIMQPYFFPYVGYFQLINAVDEFVVYDDIEYTKQGWINRNRILVNGRDEYISLPLKKDSDYLAVKDRYLAATWTTERRKILNKISSCYKHAPQFAIVFPIIEACILYEDRNLFNFIYHSLIRLKIFLDIQTVFTISSSIPYDRTKRSEHKVIDICTVLHANTYINPIGARSIGLYHKERFENQHINFHYLCSNDIRYSQYANAFVPALSMIDVMMFNSHQQMRCMLNQYTID